MRDIYNTHDIKGLSQEVKVYYPDSNEIKKTISELILENINIIDGETVLDISDYDGAKFLIPMFTNLDISDDKAKRDLKKMLKKDDSPIEPIIRDLTAILQICIMEAEKMSEGVK